MSIHWSSLILLYIYSIIIYYNYSIIQYIVCLICWNVCHFKIIIIQMLHNYTMILVARLSSSSGLMLQLRLLQLQPLHKTCMFNIDNPSTYHNEMKLIKCMDSQVMRRQEKFHEHLFLTWLLLFKKSFFSLQYRTNVNVLYYVFSMRTQDCGWWISIFVDCFRRYIVQ